MKKSLIMLPLVAALLCAGCTTTKKSGGKKKSSSVSQTSQKTSASKTSNTAAPSGTSATSEDQSLPESPWPAVPTGDGTEANPYNPTQARVEAEKLQESTTKTTVVGDHDVWVRGYVCVIEDIALDRPRQGKPDIIDNDVKFQLADDFAFATNEIVQTQDEILDKIGFGVYFAINLPSEEGKWSSYEQACAIYGKLVTVKGRLQNWLFCPQLNAQTGAHPQVVAIGESAPNADPSYTPLVTEEEAHGTSAS